MTTTLPLPAHVYSVEADCIVHEDIPKSAKEPVFPLIQRTRAELVQWVDTTLTWSQLQQPTINFSVVRPLLVKLAGNGKPPAALVYALLVCRVHFLDVASEDLAFSNLNTTRADLAELLAIKLLSGYGTAPQSLELLHVLTLPFNAFHGATTASFAEEEGVDDEEIDKLKEWGADAASNALELAVYSRAKRLVKCALFQQVIKAIYHGDVLYSPESSRRMIGDDYKQRPIVEVYDWRQHGFLDYTRLRVPAVRARIEFLSFCILLALFLAAEFYHEEARLTLWEALFILFGLGFSLDEFGSIQDGLSTYLSVSYNALDACFACVFYVYLGIRVSALLTGDLERSKLAFDTLSIGACFLAPRLTISLVHDNVVLMALAAMTREFLVFMALASIVASGFLVTLLILGRGTWRVGQIAWLMLRIWLGNSFLGFEAAQSFHQIFGPLLMVAFAILAQTLLLTILLALLSNTFSAIQAEAQTEILHAAALRTIERVKADELSSNYMPPFNLLAAVTLLPVRALASSRWTHKVHVALTKILNFPLLLTLAIYTRARQRRGALSTVVTKTRNFARFALPRGIALDGSVGALSRVFAREVTEEALHVSSMDDRQDTQGPQGLNIGPQAVSKALSNELPSSSPVQQKRRVPVSRSKSVDPASSQHQRLGSLTSPLAKVFNLEAGAQGREPEKADRIEARLEAIESALALLVGEVVKAKSAEPDEERPPLTSLTGAVEESYKD